MLLGLVFVLSQGHGADTSGSRYKIGYFKTMREMGIDLYRNCPKKYLPFINPEPVSMETEVTPTVKLADFAEDGKTLGFVFVSVGFVDLVNNIAHAKAIDTVVSKGYFDRYLALLAQESGETELKSLPDLDNPKYWSEDVMREHVNNLRQLIATVVAIKLSHHYLGHYAKYKDRLEDTAGKRTPINDLLTPQEWDAALQAGVDHSVKTGLGIEGVKALFEAIDKMPNRPGWTSYFMPKTAHYKPMKKMMEKIERKAFSGE
jgi:hypothetical protein